MLKKIAEKYTAEERLELAAAIAVLSLLGAKDAPETEEELTQWCEDFIAKKRAKG